MDVGQAPVARFGLLIRRPVAEVFDAFVNPSTTPKFWFRRSTGRLEKEATVRWYFTEDASCEVRVLAFEENQRVRVEWAADPQDATTVEWTFEPRTQDTTYVNVTNEGFSGDRDKIVGDALDSAAGFAAVLAAAKAYLEHGIQLNIVQDRF